MTRNKKGNLQVIDSLYDQIPAFTDVFTEDTFYVFVGCFVVTTIVVVAVLSRFIKIKPVE